MRSRSIFMGTQKGELPGYSSLFLTVNKGETSYLLMTILWILGFYWLPWKKKGYLIIMMTKKNIFISQWDNMWLWTTESVHTGINDITDDSRRFIFSFSVPTVGLQNVKIWICEINEKESILKKKRVLSTCRKQRGGVNFEVDESRANLINTMEKYVGFQSISDAVN